jgi:hypothetical protein
MIRVMGSASEVHSYTTGFFLFLEKLFYTTPLSIQVEALGGALLRLSKLKARSE